MLAFHLHLQCSAYLNYVFFDQDFNFISGSSNYKQVSTAAEDAHELLEFNGLVMPEAGYLFVYVSNEGHTSTGGNVYFDDLRIAHKNGPIIQEDHYYPFGMSINALSSSAPLSTPNRFKYNGKEFQPDFDIGWYDYGARNYDAQLGRWFNLDNLSEKYSNLSPYGYAASNPIMYIDPDGNDIIFIGELTEEQKAYIKKWNQTDFGKTIQRIYGDNKLEDIYIDMNAIIPRGPLGLTKFDAKNSIVAYNTVDGKFSFDRMGPIQDKFSGVEVNNKEARTHFVLINYNLYDKIKNGDYDESEVAQTITHEILAHIYFGSITAGTEEEREKAEHSIWGESVVGSIEQGSLADMAREDAKNPESRTGDTSRIWNLLIDKAIEWLKSNPEEKRDE